MRHSYVKSSDKEYRAVSRFDKKAILGAAKRLKKKRKLPTSIALDEVTVRELKVLADWRGVPYQVLMRMFILDGLHRAQPAGRR